MHKAVPHKGLPGAAVDAGFVTAGMPWLSGKGTCCTVLVAEPVLPPLVLEHAESETSTAATATVMMNFFMLNA